MKKEMNCIHCGAELPEGSQYCNVCGKSQAAGVYKVAEIAGMLGRGAYRAGFAAFFGFFAGLFFYIILFSYPGPFMGVPGSSFPNVVGGWWAPVIFGLICAVIGAIGSAPSWKFAYLIGYWCVYGFIGMICWWFTVGPFQQYIISKIVYIILLIALLPLTWIWYIVKRGLVTGPRAAGGLISTVKHELADTFKEVTRFGRR